MFELEYKSVMKRIDLSFERCPRNSVESCQDCGA
jgi:hypothetical protein